jgi:hypothetical protein
MHAVALAHRLADLQDDPADELAWDIRALNAALTCTDADAQRHSTVSSKIAAFMPSLHASLGVDYFKLGDFARSKEHLALARRFVGELADDAYGKNIRRWIDNLANDLDAGGG